MVYIFVYSLPPHSPVLVSWNKLLLYSGSKISFFQGDYIWIEPVSGREFDVAIGARVVSAEGKRILIKDDDGKVKYYLFTYILLILNTSSTLYIITTSPRVSPIHLLTQLLPLFSAIYLLFILFTWLVMMYLIKINNEKKKFSTRLWKKKVYSLNYKVLWICSIKCHHQQPSVTS
jgi:hypothetical protein